jgi:NAD(P)-dependent dehydrogenase (short-subunit alcohol dehydrogenase family)
MEKVAIVTGAASPRGIGQATARKLAGRGWALLLADVDPEALQARCEEIQAEYGTPVEIAVCDVTSREQVDQAVAKAEEAFGRIDALVNIAGITAPTRLLDIPEAEWNRIFDVDVKGIYHFVQAALPAMKRQGKGRIVSVSSVSAKRGGGIFGGPHYSAAKAAVNGFTRAVAREVGPFGITCNAVAPGLIDTDITGGQLTQEQLEKIIADIPLGRVGQPEDVAGVIAFLCSDDAAYVTGEIVDINGGSHID